MSNLFTSHHNKYPAILLIDASGSVNNNFNDILVFDQIKKIIKELDEDEFRIIFWNSDNEQIQCFREGIYKLPFIIKKSTLDQTFTFIKQNITSKCLTFPHLAFENIQSEWIIKNDITKIYFITDGEIGYAFVSTSIMDQLKNKLGNAIKKLVESYPSIRLNIITVEPKNMDFLKVETLKQAAGCDVYNVIMDNQLTKYITKFVSYTPNNIDGFIHINKNIPPIGYISFGDKYFSELKTNEFIKYISELIINTPGENELLQIVQYLSSTICSLTKDKPHSVINDIIKTFCELFANTSLDIMFIKFILTEAVEKENIGMANVFAVYRAQLKDLYKQASELLLKNVKNSIGIKESFLTLPWPQHNKLISGHFRLIDKNISINASTYPQSAITINDILMPIIPFDYENMSSLVAEQCLRQWVRLLIHKLYHVPALNDVVPYIILGIVLQVVLSDVNDNVKESYKKLGTIMLKKKRTNTDRTELDRLENGELPIPNSGKITDFYDSMDTVKNNFKINIQPLTLWYAMCLALGNNKLVTTQLNHCRESILSDYTNIEPIKLLSHIKSIIPLVTHCNIPFEHVLDYNCLITLESTAETGGYRFLPHNNMMGAICHPVYVLSDEGLELLFNNKISTECPICFSYLNKSSFTRTDKKPVLMADLDFLPKDAVNIFFNNKLDSTRMCKKVTVSTVSSDFPSKNTVSNCDKIKSGVKLNKKGIIVILKGTIGSGKSTYAGGLKTYIENLGNYCVVEGTDKYCKTGMSIPGAIDKIFEQLLKINDIDVPNNGKIVVIIDTCGEQSCNNNIIFGVDFKEWKKVYAWPNLIRSKLSEYLAWSLHNLCLRNKPTEKDNFYLNPIDVDIRKCVDIHKKKAKLLYGKKISYISVDDPSSITKVIDTIKNSAISYEKILETTMPLNEQIEKFVNKHI